MSFYFKKDPSRYKKSDFDNLIYEFQTLPYSCWSKAEMLANLFTRCKNVVYDDSFDGMAAIDIDSKRIIVNRDRILGMLLAAAPFVITNIEHFPFLVGTDYYGRECFDTEQYVSMFACYLVLHEVGHYLYTVPASFVKQKAKEVCASMHIPFSFIFFVNNVVEDSFIQRRLQLDYPIPLYRDIFFLGTTIVQGPFSIVNFVKELSEGKPLSIKDKLFYLILRAYNLFDKDVQSMFNNNPLIEWTPEALELFDKAITILDKENRCDFTTNQLVPCLFNILHEVVKIKKDELRNCCHDSSSLLDEDKLREAELDESEPDEQDDSQEQEDDEDNFSSTNDSSKGNPDSDQPEDEDGQEKDCSGETDSESESCDDDSDEDGEGNASGSDEESEEEESDDGESEGDDSDGDEDTDEEDAESSSESEEGSEEEQDDSQGDSADASSDEPETSKSQSESQSQGKTPDGKSLEEAAQELEDNFNKELDEASKELNSAIDESSEREFSEDVAESLENFANDVDSNDIANAINDVRKITQKSSKVMSNLDSYDQYKSTFDNRAQTLFNSASQLFKRIYTFDTDDLSYLDNGELDENLITDFYTEKSVNIFKQHLDLVETKKIKVVFMVDDSGSMSGKRSDNCRTIVPPLIHAFEESGIKCSFFLFGSECALIKDFDDPAVLINNSCSNILYQRDRAYVGGSTNITPALLALASRDYSDKDDTIYILFVLTDGCFDNEATASQIFNYLRTEIGFKLFGITIDDSDGVRRLRRDMYNNEPEGNDFIFNYSTEELISKLPQDIYNIIVDRFIRKS